jgi:hypothetical protein
MSEMAIFHTMAQDFPFHYSVALDHLLRQELDEEEDAEEEDEKEDDDDTTDDGYSE